MGLSWIFVQVLKFLKDLIPNSLVTLNEPARVKNIREGCQMPYTILCCFHHPVCMKHKLYSQPPTHESLKIEVVAIQFKAGAKKSLFWFLRSICELQ